MLGQKRFIPDSDDLYEGETFVRYFDTPQAGENFAASLFIYISHHYHLITLLQ